VRGFRYQYANIKLNRLHRCCTTKNLSFIQLRVDFAVTDNSIVSFIYLFSLLYIGYSLVVDT